MRDNLINSTTTDFNVQHFYIQLKNYPPTINTAQNQELNNIVNNNTYDEETVISLKNMCKHPLLR